MVFKRWWFWVLMVIALGVIGEIGGSIEEKSLSSPMTSYTNEDKVVSNYSDEYTNSIDQNLVGTWINQKERHLLKKLVLLVDGTGLWDSDQITWSVEQGNSKWDKIFFEFPYRSYDIEYTFEDNKLRLSNGCQLTKIDGKGVTTLSSLMNTRWVPDFLHYPNNYHVDNPVLKLIYVSADEKTVTFEDNFGVNYTATSTDGCRFVFTNDRMFYAFDIHGLNPEEGYDEPTIFVDVTDGGWYTVTYKTE